MISYLATSSFHNDSVYITAVLPVSVNSQEDVHLDCSQQQSFIRNLLPPYIHLVNESCIITADFKQYCWLNCLPYLDSMS